MTRHRGERSLSTWVDWLMGVHGRGGRRRRRRWLIQE